MHSDRCSEHHACAGVYVKQVLWHQRTHLRTRLLQGVHMRSCMRSLFIESWAYNEGWGVQLVYEGICCLTWGVILDRRRDRGVVCVFSILNAGGSVSVCMCMYTQTHTYTAYMGYSDVSPRVRMRHLEGPKNPDGLNLGIYMYSYMCTKYTCVCIC